MEQEFWWEVFVDNGAEGTMTIAAFNDPEEAEAFALKQKEKVFIDKWTMRNGIPCIVDDSIKK